MQKRILYQFPLSLYSEKTRWHLEAKGIDFICHNMTPGLHIIPAYLLAQQRTLPIFKDGSITIGDSTKIALHVEKNYTQNPIIPRDDEQKKQVLEYEAWFDELGDHVRRSCWNLIIDSKNIANIFFNYEGYSWFQRLVAKCSKPVLRLMVRYTFKVFPKKVIYSQHYVDQALCQLEEWLKGNPNNYLVGNTFTLADLTAASMLAPIIGPENSPWSDHHLNGENKQLRETVRNRTAGLWVLRIYREHR